MSSQQKEWRKPTPHMKGLSGIPNTNFQVFSHSLLQDRKHS
jgi:hypothetical protein